MGGSIALDSTPGDGTSFDVCLPLPAIALSPVAGPRLGPFDLRSQALGAEVAWLQLKLDARTAS